MISYIGERTSHMKKGDIRMSKIRAALFCATSLIASSQVSQAQDKKIEIVESVTVTGSRIITSIVNSPTPLTLVSTADLLKTTPSNIPDGLNKLPIFQGSHSSTTTDNASKNNTANVLALRNFGEERTLVLLDGHRITPSHANGTVSIDILPTMLMSRVDVVTGGASAVYGSDAVTGVVNFVLDKKFTGVKLETNAGLSTYADALSYQVGVAAGTSLFGGRGHIEGSLKHFHSDHVRQSARPWGRNRLTIVGPGNAASPYAQIKDGTLNSLSFGGKISCTGTTANPCGANGKQFIADGVIGPMDMGIRTATSNMSSGGDGAYYFSSSLAAMKNTDESFGRFSYDINDTTTFYVQAIAASSYGYHIHSPSYLQTGTVPNTFYKDNPFLTPAAQAALAGGTTNTFTVTKFIKNMGGVGFTSRGLDTHLSMTAGLDGTMFNKYAWNVFYTHGVNHQKMDNPRNQNNTKMYAAQDAVLNAAGNPVCYVSTTSYSSLYPGCVPMNPFGPTALTTSQYNYFTEDTNFIISTGMDDFGGGVSGELFNLPAGPVSAALSSEYRQVSYGVVSNSPPKLVDCTGLRLCNPTTNQWQGNVGNNQENKTNKIMEFAGEVQIPLLKDIPLIQELSANIAGRYTDYSMTGAVQTWKIGLNYRVNDDLRFRGTTSTDIRAPTLYDLYSPIQQNTAGFTDIHTGNMTAIARTQTQGNSKLVPEVARTYTAGFVYTPSFIPGLILSLDYYRINLKNALGNISGSSTTIQNLCEVSNGTSAFCSLYVRPLPFSDRTAANFPSLVLTQQLNAALNKTEGWDLEVDYNFELTDLLEGLPGDIALRALFNDQPYNSLQSAPGQVLTETAVPKARATTFVGYTIGDWSLNVQDRWLSSFRRSPQPSLIFYEKKRGDAINYIDININKDFEIFSAYIAVQNIMNTPMPEEPTQNSVPGLFPGGIGSGSGRAYGFDVMGRYFTIGVRASF
jgi:iron complex outermembrane recepter protein